jgi:phenylalanine-4-hydroxylase
MTLVMLLRVLWEWDDNIRMYVRETGCEDVDWIHLAQDRRQWRTLVNRATNILVLLKTRNFFTGLATVSFSRRIMLNEVV